MFKRFPFIHNHGDFVHLDALRDWLRGVVSLESFLKSKDDKAIVKDIHFTDETTSVDYIDTKDDTEKTEILCKYLTSDVYDKNNSNKLNKVDKITVIKDSRGENWINMREKATQGQRLGVIRSNVPVAYDATDDFSTSQNRSAYLGITNRSINIYNDDTLKVYKKYWFASPIAYDVDDDNYASAKKASYFSVNDNGIVLYDNNTFQKIREYNFNSGTSALSESASIVEMPLSDCNPFGSITNQATSETLNFQNTDFKATVVGDVVIGGQIMYTFDSEIWLDPKETIRLMLTPGTMGSSKFADTVYPKVVMTPNNSNVNINIMKMPPFPMTNSTPTYITITNTIESRSLIQSLHFTF